MLAYRHAFHAANHADVLKHVVLLGCLNHMTRKDKPFLYMDTHAGAGWYDLDRGYAAQNDEWAGGLARLREYAASEPPPPAVAAYLDAVTAWSAGHGEATYPGSPALAIGTLRPQDQARLCELHSADHELLEGRFSADGRVRVYRENGFAVLKASLPPPSRRGLVLVDPSYELSGDYDLTADALEDAARRFPTGMFVVWYPLIVGYDRRERSAASLVDRLSSLSAGRGPLPRLLASLTVGGVIEGGRGMAGSGVVVLNPPWTLGPALEAALPYLVRALSPGGKGTWTLAG